MRPLLPVCFLLAMPAPILAQEAAISEPIRATCQASVEGATIYLVDDGTPAEQAADLPDCPPLTVLRHLTPALAEGERGAFCLVEDAEAGTISGFSEGNRKDDMTCQSASGFCERVNASKDAAMEIAGLSSDASVTEQAGAAVSGARSLSERAGATILTGSGGAVASTLSNLGATALATVTAPAAIAAGVVSVVAVGGAVYVCR